MTLSPLVYYEVYLHVLCIGLLLLLLGLIHIFTCSFFQNSRIFFSINKCPVALVHRENHIRKLQYGEIKVYMDGLVAEVQNTNFFSSLHCSQHFRMDVASIHVDASMMLMYLLSEIGCFRFSMGPLSSFLPWIFHRARLWRGHQSCLQWSHTRLVIPPEAARFRSGSQKWLLKIWVSSIFDGSCVKLHRAD